MKLAKTPLMHQPGDAYADGINQDVQGALIERVTGKHSAWFHALLPVRALRARDRSRSVS